MALENAVIKGIFDEILAQPDYSNDYKLAIEIITPEHAIRIDDIDFCTYDVDSATRYGPIIMLGCRIPAGTYTQGVYPFRDKLKVTLYRTVKVRSNDITFGKTYQSTYTATLATNDDVNMTLRNRPPKSQGDLDNAAFLDIVFQLQEPNVERARLTHVGTIMRDVTLETVLRIMMAPELIGNTSTQALKGDSYQGVKGVDITPITNSQKHEYVLIPPDTLQIDLPDILQRDYGLYSTGVGVFFERGQWYIYPLIDTKQFGKKERTLTLYSLSPTEISSAEKTYIIKGSGIHAITSNGIDLIDETESFMQNSGNGLRYYKTTALFNGMVTGEGNKMIVDKKSNFKETVIRERENKMNNAKFIDGMWTDNPYPALSKLSRGMARVIKCVWESCNPEKLYPGMPCRVLYISDDQVKTLTGVIFAYVVSYVKSSSKITDTTFTPRAHILMFV